MSWWYLPAHQGFERSNSTDSYRADNNGHDTQRTHTKEDAVRLAHAHAQELLGNSFSEEGGGRRKIAEQIVGKLVTGDLARVFLRGCHDGNVLSNTCRHIREGKTPIAFYRDYPGSRSLMN